MRDGWEERQLSEVCSISSKLVDPREPEFIDLPHLGAGNMISMTGELVEIKTAREESLKSGKFTFDDTMVLYSKIRPYLMKACRPNFDGLCSADVYPLSPHADCLDKDFLFHMLMSRHFTDYAISGSDRAGMPKVNRNHLFRYRFSLPPLREQKRIVVILDEALEGIGRAAGNAEKNLANARELFESYLNAVFDHTRGSQALEGLGVRSESLAPENHSEVRQHKLRSIVDPGNSAPGATKTGGRAATTRHIPGKLSLSVGLPQGPTRPGWKWTALTKLARLESGHTPSRRHPEYWGGDIPWIGIRDAREAHGRKISDTLQRTNELGIQNSSARILPAQTVCLSRTASVGYVVVMARPMATSQDFVNWICSENLEPHFLKYLFLAQGSEIFRFSSGAIHQTIYFPEAKAFCICHPDVEEQRRIVAQADALRSESNRLESIYQKTLDDLAELKQSILQKAFSGELTLQSAENVSIASHAKSTDTKSPAFSAQVIAFAYQRHEENRREKTFGHVKAQKLLHLAESLGEIELGRVPVKDAAGPNDFPHMIKAEDWAKEQEFFRFVKRGEGYEFRKLARYDAMLAVAREAVQPYRNQMDSVIELILPMNSRRAEVFATIHAAWNNLILDGVDASSAAIHRAASEDWHSKKKKISNLEFDLAIELMRRKGLVPDGKAKRVVPGQERLF